MVGTEVPFVPIIKANLSRADYTKWLIAKAKIGDGREINNKDTLLRLISHYDKDKGRKLI